MYKLSELQENALDSIDERIAAKHLEVQAHKDPDQVRTEVAHWRADQEQKISELFRRLGGDDLENDELARFKIDPMPKADSYARDRAVRELRDLQGRRSQIAAKAASLVADKDGNIHLTKTQLKEIFDL